MSLWDVYDLCEYAQKKLPNIQIAKETCQATRIRQEAIAKVPEEVELVTSSAILTAITQLNWQPLPVKKHTKKSSN